MSSEDTRAGTDRAGPDPKQQRDFQRAVNQLEGAVDELVSMAKEQFSDRATSFVQDTADRLQREIETRRDGHRSSRRARYARYTYAGVRSSNNNPYQTRRLFRDVRRQRICGVCAGIARYFGVEIWVVRCIAVTGVIFMPSIVIPAYIIACFLMRKSTDGETPMATSKPSADHSSPAPELGSRLSPRRSLRDVHSTLDQVELKLRRMESHVTSGQFELQRELRKIDT